MSEQGASSQTLSRASLIIKYLLRAGVCLTTGRKSESAASLVSNQILHAVCLTQSNAQALFSEACFLLSRDEWESCKYKQPD